MPAKIVLKISDCFKDFFNFPPEAVPQQNEYMLIIIFYNMNIIIKEQEEFLIFNMSSNM